ncbi:MAG: glycosyl hydrolase family 32 [Moorea sp. SIO1F2]|uniref:hypothetical protein n=1 Tax=Moorena sp. SIO1F2 TaxID=2607819 RepID=UPI0013BE4877|nr:hypothetical protein [Moorena sp. SIO1F2]NET86373.1 glycosyl hydrolase family 32 [Moorena sp. SIO1F2]
MLPNHSLQIPDKWIWDFWLAQDISDYHLFYLQASKDLPDPEDRHWHVSFGHAVSQDLRHWEILPDAMKPEAYGDVDEYTNWTGCVIRHDGLWYLPYTSTDRKEQGKIQRISLATSKDLIHWEKHPKNPVIEADSRYYEKYDLEHPEKNLWFDEAWRDPWVFQDPETGEFHALITGRVNYGPAESRGVIAHATSQNLIDWQVLPPLTEPMTFGTMECPQVVLIKGRYYLLFSIPPGEFVDSNLTGTFYMVADNPLGPFSAPRALWADSVKRLYSGKLVQGPDQIWYFMSWRNFALDGSFLGDISEPLAITVDEEGNLIVLEPAMVH